MITVRDAAHKPIGWVWDLADYPGSPREFVNRRRRAAATRVGAAQIMDTRFCLHPHKLPACVRGYCLQAGVVPVRIGSTTNAGSAWALVQLPAAHMDDVVRMLKCPPKTEPEKSRWRPHPDWDAPRALYLLQL